MRLERAFVCLPRCLEGAPREAEMSHHIFSVSALSHEKSNQGGEGKGERERERSIKSARHVGLGLSGIPALRKKRNMSLRPAWVHLDT